MDKITYTKDDLIKKLSHKLAFSYDDMKIGQGRENAKHYLSENDDVYSEIIQKVRSFMGINGAEEE